MLWGDKKWYPQGNKNFANGVDEILETIARYKLYINLLLIICILVYISM